MDPMKEIRCFAIENKPYIKVNGIFCQSEAFFWYHGVKIYNPWETPTGFHQLTTQEAFQLYGTENMDRFCNKAENYISKEIYSKSLSVPMLPEGILLRKTDLDDSGNFPCPWMCSFGYRFQYSGENKYNGRKIHYATVEVLAVPIKDNTVQYFAEDDTETFEPQINSRVFSDILDVCFDREKIMDFRIRKSAAEAMFRSCGWSDIKFFVVEYGIGITHEKIPMKIVFGKWRENVVLQNIGREDLRHTIFKDLDNWDLCCNVMNTASFFDTYEKFTDKEEKILFSSMNKEDYNV